MLVNIRIYLKETLKGILDNIGIAASNDYLDSDLDSSLLQEVDAPPNLNSYTTVEKSNEGRKLTLFTCKICTKTFKYAKPFMNHMLNHNPNFIESELESNTLTCQICMRTFKSSKLYVKHKATHDEDYSNDYRLPYYYSKQLDQNQEPAVKKGRGRPRKTIDFSPPEHDTLISTNVMNSVNQIDYSETFPSYSNPAASSTLMASPEKRGRGRPRKFPIKYQESSQKNTFQVPMTSIASSSGYVKKAPEERKMHWKQKLALEKKSALAIKQEDSTNSSCIKPSSFQHQDDDIFSGFVEVDLNKVLKKKTTDDDASNSSKSLKKIKIEKSSSRSRSPSIELIQEEDIFNTS